MGRFPWAGRFILRVKRGLFLNGKASLVGRTGITVINGEQGAGSEHCTPAVHTQGGTGRRIYTLGTQGGMYRVGYPSYHTQGGIYWA